MSCYVPHGSKGQLSYQVRQSLNRIYLSFIRLAERLSVFLAVTHRLVGQVVKASTPIAEGPEFESRLRQDFAGSSHTGELKIGTPVAILPGALGYRVSAGTGRLGVRIL